MGVFNDSKAHERVSKWVGFNVVFRDFSALTNAHGRHITVNVLDFKSTNECHLVPTSFRAEKSF